MTIHNGILKKMDTLLGDELSEHDKAVQYYLRMGDVKVWVNRWLGKRLELTYRHEIRCIHCGRVTKTSFAQGYCYSCFIRLPETDECVLHPELCRAHEGISRDMEWSKEHCLQDHIVYFAVSSGLKVGVTRISQVPTRWIDQGAWKAIRLARTPNRFLAGTMEVALKGYFQDKTEWRSMLKDEVDRSVDLVREKWRAAELLPHDMHQYLVDDDTIVEITYPVLEYPGRVSALNLDNTDHFAGELTGIKGQYLIFGDGHVLNIRKHGGYLVSLGY